MVVDILGFSDIITNISENDLLIERINEWIEIVEVLSKKHGVSQYQLISDTLFVGIDKEEPSFQNLLRFSKDLLEQCTAKSLLLRGGIAFGNYIWGKLIYGDAVIKAHNLEINQQWVGITLEIDVPKPQSCFDEKLIIVYRPPLKSGKTVAMASVVWGIPTSDNLLNLSGKKGLAKVGQPLMWHTSQKIINTILYRIYIDYHKKMNLPFDKFFGGLLPISYLDEQLVGKTS